MAKSVQDGRTGQVTHIEKGPEGPFSFSTIMYVTAMRSVITSLRRC